MTYYGVLAFAEALLVADPRTAHTLSTIEHATKYGHGIKNIVVPTQDFPFSEKVYLSSDGLLATYLQALGFDHRPFSLSASQAENLSNRPGVDEPKLMSLPSLLARVPEIASVYCDVVGPAPLNVHVFDVTGQIHNASAEVEGVRPVGFQAPVVLSDQYVREVLSPPFANLRRHRDGNEEFWLGDVAIRTGKSWSDNIELHRSSMCPTSWVKPLFPGLADQLAVHCALLYALSILVRYRPSRWREVVEGSSDAYFALIREYVSAAQRVVPEMILGRLTERVVYATQPGSIFGLA